jgi:uncharacterized membrane protein
MSWETKRAHSVLMAPQRLQTLIDGIFAVAMTLLVFNLKVPQGPLSSVEFNRALFLLLPQFWTFGQSFLLLGIFWSASHRLSRFMEYTDATHLWIHIVWLMFVALVPFSTSLLGHFSYYLACALFFHSNMLTVGLLYYFIWRYAARHGLLRSLSKAAIRRIDMRNLVFPAIALCASGVSFISPLWSNLVYLLIPSS